MADVVEEVVDGREEVPLRDGSEPHSSEDSPVVDGSQGESDHNTLEPEHEHEHEHEPENEHEHEHELVDDAVVPGQSPEHEDSMAMAQSTDDDGSAHYGGSDYREYDDDVAGEHGEHDNVNSAEDDDTNNDDDSGRLLFSSSFWGPNGIDTVRKRIEDTGRSLKMLQTFIQERAALEEQYAASLRELLKRHAAPFPDPWSTSEAWKALRAEADETQRVHQQLSQQLATEVARPLEYFHRQQSQSSKLQISEAVKNTKELTQHELKLKTLRDAYHKCGNQAVVAQKALEAAKASKTSQAVGKCSSKVEKEMREYQEAQKHYEEQFEKTRSFQEKWEDSLVDIMNHLQVAEEARVDEVRRVLTSFVHVISSHQDYMRNSCDAITATGIAALDPRRDSESFVAASATGFERPPYPELQQFELPPALEHLLEKRTRKGTVLPSVQHRNTRAMSIEGGGLASFMQCPRVRALHDFIGVESDELDFFAGDVFPVFDKDEATGWWSGYNHHRCGYFPHHYVELV